MNKIRNSKNAKILLSKPVALLSLCAYISIVLSNQNNQYILSFKTASSVYIKKQLFLVSQDSTWLFRYYLATYSSLTVGLVVPSKQDQVSNAHQVSSS